MRKCITCGVDLGFFSTAKECTSCKIKRESAERAGHGKMGLEIKSEKKYSASQAYFGRGVKKNYIDSAISQFFQNNEFVIGAFLGSYPGLTLLEQYLIISNIRVIFWKKGILINENNAFHFEDISGIKEKAHGLLLAGIELNIHGAKEIFPYMYREEVPLAVKLIRDQIQKTKN